MPGIAVVGLDSAGGKQLGGSNDFVTIDGAFIVCIDDPVEPHGPGTHLVPKMVEGSSFVTINGKPICFAGNRASCDHTTSGRPWDTVTG